MESKCPVVGNGCMTPLLFSLLFARTILNLLSPPGSSFSTSLSSSDSRITTSRRRERWRVLFVKKNWFPCRREISCLSNISLRSTMPFSFFSKNVLMALWFDPFWLSAESSPLIPPKSVLSSFSSSWYHVLSSSSEFSLAFYSFSSSMSVITFVILLTVWHPMHCHTSYDVTPIHCPILYSITSHSLS